MAVLHRSKAPAAAGDQTVAHDRPAADDPPATERRTAATDNTVVDEPTATRRRGWRRRRHDPAAPGVGLRAAWAGAGVVATIARVIRLVAAVVALVIALGIVFVALKASPGNTIVSHVHDWGSWLTTPFHNMFHVHGARGTLALNWGIALIVYLAVAWLVTRILLAPWRAVRRRTASV